MKKLRIKLRFLHRNKYFARKRIIEAIFISVLEYGDVIYGNVSHRTLWDASPGCCVSFCPPFCHWAQLWYTSLYSVQQGWLASFIWEKRFVYKSIIALLPPYLSSLIIVLYFTLLYYLLYLFIDVLTFTLPSAPL